MEQRAVQLVTSYIQKPDKERQLIFLPLMRKGFPGGSAGKEFACNVGDLGSTLGLGTMQAMVSPRLVFVVQVIWCHGRWSQAIRAGLFGPQCPTSLSTVFPTHLQIH